MNGDGKSEAASLDQMYLMTNNACNLLENIIDAFGEDKAASSRGEAMLPQEDEDAELDLLSQSLEKLDSMPSDVSRFQSKIVQLVNVVRQYENKIRVTESNLLQAQNEVRSKKAEIQQLSSQLSDLERANKAKLEKFSVWTQNLSSQLEGEEAKKVQLKQEISMLHSKLEEKEEKLEQLRADLKNSESEARKRYVQFQNDKGKEVSEWKSKFEETNLNLREKTERLHQVVEAHEKQAVEMKKLQAYANHLKIDVDAGNVKIQELRKENSQLRGQVSDLYVKVNSARKETYETRKKLDVSEEKLRDFDFLFAPLKKSHSALEKSLETSNIEKHRMERELLERAETIEALHANDEKAQKEIEMWRIRYENSEQELHDLKLKKNAKMNEMQEEIVQRDRKILLLREEKGIVLDREDRLKKKSMLLSQEVVELTRKVQELENDVEVQERCMRELMLERDSLEKLLVLRKDIEHDRRKVDRGRTDGEGEGNAGESYFKRGRKFKVSQSTSSLSPEKPQQPLRWSSARVPRKPRTDDEVESMILQDLEFLQALQTGRQADK